MINTEQVIDFNQTVLGVEARLKGLLENAELSISHKCMVEEADELLTAHKEFDFIGSVDACLDSIYFSVGVLYKLGLTSKEMSDCFDAVHNANMEKKKGTNAKRDTGAADAVKPEGWIAPEKRIAKILGMD